MRETIAGLAKIAKHFEVSVKTVQDWLSKGMPHRRREDGVDIVIDTMAAEAWLNNYRRYANIFGGNYLVKIESDNEVLWSHGSKNSSPFGMTCHGYYQDGTIEQIAGALKNALEQCGYHVELTPHDGTIELAPLAEQY